MKIWVLGVIGLGLAVCVSTQAAINVTCSSERGGREYCQADTGSGAELLHQISSAICRKGYSWGRDGSGVWVDHGCKAVFAISNLGLLGALVDNGKDYVQTHTFSCAADGGKKRHFCQADTRGGLRMLHPVNSCVYDKTWGYDAGGVWVEKNCKAEFEVGGAASYTPPEVPGTGHVWGAGNGLKSFTCASDSDAKRYCEADTSAGAVLVKNLGPGACVRGENWGFDRRGVWVGAGCRGEFNTIFRETILK